jgi:hypothetical protein
MTLTAIVRDDFKHTSRNGSLTVIYCGAGIIPASIHLFCSRVIGWTSGLVPIQSRFHLVVETVVQT